MREWGRQVRKDASLPEMEGEKRFREF